MNGRGDDTGDGFGPGSFWRPGEQSRLRIGAAGNAGEEQAITEMRRQVREAVQKVEARAARRRAGIDVPRTTERPSLEPEATGDRSPHKSSPADVTADDAVNEDSPARNGDASVDDLLVAPPAAAADANAPDGDAPPQAFPTRSRLRWPLRVLVFVGLLCLGGVAAFVLGRNQSDDRIELHPAPAGDGSDLASGIPGENGTGGTLTSAEREELESLLASLGFRTGPLDGRIDAQTRQAIRAFQRISGDQSADGKASRTLLEELRAMATHAGD